MTKSKTELLSPKSKVAHTRKPLLASEVKPSFDLVVFCHVRWKFVYQRPQHIISRLAATHHILFVEEPIPFAPEDAFGYHLEKVASNITVLQPKVSNLSELGKLLKQLKFTQFNTAWFYSPAFADILPDLKVDTIVYDCMDELSLFKGASESLRIKERYLIKEADLIFTGGKSLYESKSKISSNVHCFPSSVDIAHFKKVERALSIPGDIKHLSHPIVGYIGVIDERIDFPLIAATADLLPQFQFVMIGPLAKIDEGDLPRRDNIHYLGMKDYSILPNYLKAIDIAMMPFALNDATKYISPTKTLEYMAAGKPIISTAVKDVVRDYQEQVAIVDSPQQFYEALQHMVHLKDVDYHDRYNDILRKTSWDHTVSQMLKLLMVAAQ